MLWSLPLPTHTAYALSDPKSQFTVSMIRAPAVKFVSYSTVNVDE